MGWKILDGKGTGKEAQVDDDNRLQTASVTSDRAVVSNLADGDAFVFSSGFVSFAAGVETRFFYIKNTDKSRVLILDSFVVTTDGGTTTNSKPLAARVYVGASEPTANQVERDPVGLNTESSKRAEADFYIWDEVSTGIVQATPGLNIIEDYYAVGFTPNVLPAKLALGPTKTYTLSFECTEACIASFQLYAHY